MFIKLSALSFYLLLFCVRGSRLEWDLAVVVENELKLLTSKGEDINSRSQPFSSLKAITYDGIRDQFIVSDTDLQFKNDTIFTVILNKETDVTIPIIQNLPGDVKGLAVDPQEDVLYWTDVFGHTINKVALNDTSFISKEYLKFDDKVPHAIVIDVCNRYIYYSNPSGESPTIERMRLDKSGHEVLVKNTIMSPVGLAIDYKDQRLYWADSRIGAAAGRIESVALDGTDRKLIVERNSMEPYGLAVDDDAIYWTDTNNHVLFKFLKSTKDPYADPEKLKTFSGTPMGIVTKNYLHHKECRNLNAAIREYKERRKEEETQMVPLDESELSKCLNGEIVNKTYCKCQSGYRGNYCEISLCNNYCINGNCMLSNAGKPVCSCDTGYSGARCEKNLCDRYCLNNGECEIDSANGSPNCDCPEAFFGKRCEYNVQQCDNYCNKRSENNYSDSLDLLCRCNSIYPGKNASAALKSVLPEQSDLISKLEDPIVYLSSFLLCSLLIIVALIAYIRHIQKRRPRIKKRIIVNKSIHPLTYRPQPKSEQCEITIENCCNMNICETPCFEPTRDDKKTLLTNMEEDY